MSEEPRYCSQIGFSVRDFDAAMALWSTNKGAGPWHFMPEVGADNYICGQVTYFVHDFEAGTPVRKQPFWVASNPAKPWRSRVVRAAGLEPARP
ncbi:MAG: hypothetical protein QGG54_22710 [Gammaproteobacteria bacterium]|nr:hypothetical protein [Gammaproteobacteria bacterium]